jgi:hypothetical protein
MVRNISRSAHRYTIPAPLTSFSPAHDRFVVAEDEVLAAPAEDLPDLKTACQFSGARGDLHAAPRWAEVSKNLTRLGGKG